jgi:hypothetical protein
LSQINNCGTGSDRTQSTAEIRKQTKGGELAIHSASLLQISPGRHLTGIHKESGRLANQDRPGAQASTYILIKEGEGGWKDVG